ncbi:aa3-type cytochrome oxidase subunit CtaJ [Williamsia sp. MIQD14]|uniref:aa3-type cytochrome oxidase subunit CtaJ n=1 Tax=Williamsia sp. MIQD14 TaxID=3425703 RepID=UPI003DA0DE5B
MDDLIVAIGVPVTIICIVFVIGCVVSMAWAFGAKYEKTTPYTLDQEWTRDPMLLSATDAAPLSAVHHDLGADELIGGSASGKW